MFTVFSKIIFSDASSTDFAGYRVAMLNDVSHSMQALGKSFQKYLFRRAVAL